MLMTSVNWCGAEYKDVDSPGDRAQSQNVPAVGRQVAEWKSSRIHWCRRKLLIHVRARRSGLASTGTIFVLLCKTTTCCHPTYGLWMMVFFVCVSLQYIQNVFFVSIIWSEVKTIRVLQVVSVKQRPCCWKNNHNKQRLTGFFVVCLRDKLVTVYEDRPPVREHFLFYFAKSCRYNYLYQRSMEWL